MPLFSTASRGRQKIQPPLVHVQVVLQGLTACKPAKQKQTCVVSSVVTGRLQLQNNP